MSFSANKLRIFMGLPSSQFPILPRSHERTTGNWLAYQRVRCELGSLAKRRVCLLPERFMPSVLTSRLPAVGLLSKWKGSPYA